MATRYTELRDAESAEERGRRLPIGGKAGKMREPLGGDDRAAAAAYDHLQNLREVDREVAQARYEGSPGQADRAPFNFTTGVDKKGDRYSK